MVGMRGAEGAGRGGVLAKRGEVAGTASLAGAQGLVTPFSLVLTERSREAGSSFDSAVCEVPEDG